MTFLDRGMARGRLESKPCHVQPRPVPAVAPPASSPFPRSGERSGRRTSATEPASSTCSSAGMPSRRTTTLIGGLAHVPHVESGFSVSRTIAARNSCLCANAEQLLALDRVLDQSQSSAGSSSSWCSGTSKRDPDQSPRAGRRSITANGRSPLNTRNRRYRLGNRTSAPTASATSRTTCVTRGPLADASVTSGTTRYGY